eukprot:COSAG02_NODE_179_length_31090_cov_49.813785_7_plen_60_part_00
MPFDTGLKFRMPGVTPGIRALCPVSSRKAAAGTWPCTGRIGMPAKQAACQHPAGPTRLA